MEVIALRGVPSCGKTSTLAIVYQFLLLNEYTQMPRRLKKVSDLNKDFRDVLKNSGKKIGIVTDGDVADNVKKHLKYFKSSGCYIALCAIRKGPEFTKVISKYRTHKFVNKCKTKNPLLQRIEDGISAREIYKMI